jgi:antirestriction protein
MPTITVAFNFSRGDETQSVERDIDASGSVEHDIDAYSGDIYDELNPGETGEDGTWEFDEYEVTDWDDDYADPAGFSDLDEYGEYTDMCDEHGEGYRLRYEDIGDFEFDDSYEGCWASAEEFVQERCEDCHDIPDFLAGHIDWESLARDWMMDYSEYMGDDGIHIFRD